MKGKPGTFRYEPSPAIAYREIEGQVLVLRKGARHYHLIKIVSEARP